MKRCVALVLLSLLGATPVLAQEPIRVGFLTILTGPLAAPGKDMENGIEHLPRLPSGERVG